jgi:hypothetical protein
MDQALPRAIQQQLEEAEAIQRQLAGETQVTDPNTSDPAADFSAQTATSQSDAVAAPAAQPSTDDFEQRYRVLQGKYNAEVPRLQAALRENMAQFQETLARLTALEQAQKAKVEQPIQRHTAEDVETFGEDMVRMVVSIAERTAADVFNRLAADLRGEMAPIRQSVQQVQETAAKTDIERYFDAVKKQEPDWDAIEADPRWHAFLDSRAVGAVETHRAMAERAVTARSVEAVVELVRAWKQVAGLAAQAAQQDNPRQELERQIAPSSQRGASPPQGQRIWTMGEYEQAFDTRNQTRIGLKAWNDLMAAADAALAEGRVR